MLLVRIQNLTFRYQDQVGPLLKDVNACFDSSQRVGLIGKNGTGKSTLLKILLKQESAGRGAIYIKDSLTIGYLPQKITDHPGTVVEDFLWQIRPDLSALRRRTRLYLDGATVDHSVPGEYAAAGGYCFEIEVEQTMNRFGFPPETMRSSVGAVSSGERTKLGLARVLLTRPGLVLMDEPSNHLDLDTLQWLEEFLEQCSLPFIVVSHDRRFLDRCCNTIWELDGGGLHEYRGNYTWYLNARDQERNRLKKEYEKHVKKVRQLKQAAAKRKGWSFSHQAQTGRNGYAPVYESLSNKAKNTMRQAKAIEKRIELSIEREEAKKPVIEKVRKVILNSISLKNKTVLEVKNLGKMYDDTTVFSGLSFQVPNGVRLAVRGKNGSGKTTLLEIITGRLKASTGSFRWAAQACIGYFSQEQVTLNPKNSILREVMGEQQENQSRARTILGCLNIRRDMVHRTIAGLSAGERSKVELARVILANANVLVLDEPTNHLEISAREAIEKALLEFSGTILFVSHDRYFSSKLATHELDLVRCLFRPVI